MTFWAFFNSKTNREKWEIEKEFIRERNEQKLELERRRKEIDLLTAEKRAAVERARLDYQLREEEERLKEDFAEEIDDDDDGNDSEMMKILAPAIAKFINPNQSQPAAVFKSDDDAYKPPNPPAMVELSDDEINTIYQATDKKYIAMARIMPDDKIKSFLLSRYPNLSDDTIKRAILRIKR